MTYKNRVDQNSFNMEDCKLSLRLLLLPTHSVPLKYKSVDIKQEHGGLQAKFTFIVITNTFSSIEVQVG